MTSPQSESLWYRTQPFVYPLALIFQFMLPIWLIGFVAPTILWTDPMTSGPPLQDARDNPEWLPAVIIWFLLALTELLWILPLIYALYSARIVAPTYNARGGGSPRSFHKIYQVIGPNSQVRRYCPYCKAFKEDRWNHCVGLGKCLPFYDHNCLYWAGYVWAHNVKAFMMMVTFVPLHQLFCGGFSAWVLSSANHHRHGTEICGILIIFLPCFLWSVDNAHYFWRKLICRNTTKPDSTAGEIYLWSSDKQTTFTWNVKEHAENPWDLGAWQNARFILGPWYQWLLFWKSTPLMDTIRKREQLPFRESLKW